MDAMVSTPQTRNFQLALVGNPNCGKTALFNALTGSLQKVANYPGVTVERKEGRMRTPAGRDVTVIDLPGTYSLQGRSPDEVVTRQAVFGQIEGDERPDLLVCVADASNLRLILRLVLELKASGLPMVLVLNMMDVAKYRGIAIDSKGLSAKLGIPVVETIATRALGRDDLLDQLDTAMDVPLEKLPPHGLDQTVSEVRDAYHLADSLVHEFVSKTGKDRDWTDRIDAVLLNPVAGIPILLAILFLMFQAVFSWANTPMDMITSGVEALASFVASVLPDGLLSHLLVDGVIAGVGAVLVFLPQIMILFFFIILLEDLGYMARAAFLMDKLIGGVGLHGRSFIPLLSSFACAIPGIMATRVIENRRQRLATIFIAPLMTCSARLPLYTLIISAFIPAKSLAGGTNLRGLVMFGLYAAGIIGAMVVAWVVRFLSRSRSSEPFIMELPGYKLPSMRSVVRGVLQRAYIFLRRAGTIILAMMILVWFMSSFPGAPEGATGPAIDYSFAGMLGHAMEPLLAPLGFNWQISVALVPGLAAREVAVGALATIYSVSGELGEDALGGILSAHWSLATALALLAWYVFAPQCLSTFAVVRRETNSWRWPALMFGYMLALAYGAAYLTYQLSVAAGWG